MGYFVRNFHVFVFALVSILSAVWVANNPHRTVRLIRPLVEDAVELQGLAQGAYDEVREVSWKRVAGEAVTLYVSTLRMPTMLFERLADRIGDVERQMKRRQRVDAASDPDMPRPALVVSGTQFKGRWQTGTARHQPKT